MSAKYMYACMRRQGPSKTLLGKDGGPATNIDDSYGLFAFFVFISGKISVSPHT